jgi:hypothetical protein
VWLVLFFGGAMIPGSTGLLLSSVPPSLRAFSAAMSMFVYNISGYGAGSIFPGICMQVAKGFGYGGKDTMRIGMDLVFLWSLFGVLWMYLASVMAVKEREASKDRSIAIHEEERRRGRVLASLEKGSGTKPGREETAPLRPRLSDGLPRADFGSFQVEGLEDATERPDHKHGP